MTDTNDAERQTIARLAEELVPTLIERLASSDLGELEVRENGWRVRLRRPLAEAPVNGAAAAAATHRVPAVHSAESHPPRREPPRGVVTSPGVGYFSPRDGVAPGTKVRAGDLIGVVDVLGVRHEVVSPQDGVLRAFEVEPGQAVEYGQPIGRLDV